MLSRKMAIVESVDPAKRASDESPLRGIQRLTTQFGPAINYVELTGALSVGDLVLINCTATDMQLGTGGDDFVIARLSPLPETTPPAQRSTGHVMKLRYTPLQHSVLHIEEMSQFHESLQKRLEGFPVVAAELHSQVPAIVAAGWEDFSCEYIMTDAAALSSDISTLISSLKSANEYFHVITVGQAFGFNFNAVTLHNALLFTHGVLDSDYAVVCQGPGNTGTGTKYGFSGIEQASNLDIIAALGGTPIACVRASSGDRRERHQGISHHTMTVLELVRSRCIVALPEGLNAPTEWLEKHDVRSVPREKTQPALDLLHEKGINVTTMGRTIDEDPVFFHAAAAAGIIAAEIAASQSQP